MRERQRAGNRCRAAHIGLHRIHKRALFDAAAAESKVILLPDEQACTGPLIAGWVCQSSASSTGGRSELAANGMQR